MNIFPMQSITSELEQNRLNALKNYQILDTPPDPSFDNITLLASKLLNVPIALISFVDEHRIWSKSHFGTDVDEYDRVEGLCSTAILDNIPLIIYDASTDQRCINHPLVKQKDGVRFYAGIPLNFEGKYNLGTLCIIDFKPRPILSDLEVETLQLLSKMAVDAIKSHAKNLEIIDLHNMLQKTEQRWSFALDGTNQGVWDLNVTTNKIFLSPRCKEMLGYSEDQISTDMNEWVKLIHPEDIPCLFSARMQALDGESKSFENEHRKLTSDGSYKWIQVKGMVVERDKENAPLRVIGTYTDISERKKIEADVLHLAHFDNVTNLPNRTLFLDRLNQEIKKSRRNGTTFALMLLDLDRFKEVNDSLGHQKGDLLLEEIANRLTSCVRESDTVARLGGDEFTIILSETNRTNDIDLLIIKILNSVASPCFLDGDVSYVTASIGIAIYPSDTIDSDDLLKQADQAMYTAKKNGKNTYAFFTPAMQKNATEKIKVANNLRNALAKNEFLLLYQPIINLKTLQMHKAEALIRWQNPNEGLISPALFIPVAEETGQIVEIGEWVFSEAANAIKTCREKIYPDFQISVNKSPVQFRVNNEPHISWFEHLNSLNLPGNSLVVEITEGLLIDKSDSLKEKFRALKDAGIQIALDDFGTGYSSLSYLKLYNMDYIKIDQAFVKNLAPESQDFVLCEAIIVMAHKLNMRVIAEGVETALQLELLQSIDCDFAQGYYFSRPIKLEDLYNFRVN